MELETKLTRVLQALEAGAPQRATRERYFKAEQPLAFLAPEARAAIGSRFGRIASNICHVAVTSMAERLRVTGFTGDPGTVWDDWRRNDLDQLAGIAHREALTLGESYVIVWADDYGRPLVTVESPEQVAVMRDPATREVIRAAKRWESPAGTHAVMYEADKITKWRAPNPGAYVSGFNLVETLHNPFGVVPVVPLRNSDRLLGPAASELDDLMPLVDALNKTLADMLVASEYAGRPRRWGTGIELVEDEEGNVQNPYPEANRMMISEAPDAKFGALPAADLASYEAAVRVLQAQISAVSGLPPHYLGAHGDQPASADAMRAAEASLVAKVEARQAVFGRSWEQVARLMVAVRTGLPPHAIELAVQWADPATRSIAQEADAVVKLFSAGLLPASFALRKLGYSDDEVGQIRAARRAEALDTTGMDFGALAVPDEA
jgi:hypothetical protein